MRSQVSWRLPDTSWRSSLERARRRHEQERLALHARRRKACWQRGMLIFAASWSLLAAIEVGVIALTHALR